MVPGPANFISRHATFIEQRGAAARQHRYYIKWLHYHLDSCHEYNLIHTEDESLSDLTGKLKEKKRQKTLESRDIMPSLFYGPKHCSGRKTNSTSSGNPSHRDGFH
ncbi:hypothetical protein BMS3Bbin14_02283 [bacterium BMS3Bbin14]|nr:hypothetical protein BMS3Bbin14_02283 [bacterium BMS3Bbin14]